MTFVIERESLAHLAIWLPTRAIVNTLGALYAILATVCGWWRPVAIAAVLVSAVVVCAAFPVLPAGLGLIAAFGFVTYPRSKAVRNG